MTRSKYRPDIDGLRAVSVVAIVLFHAQFGLIPGGFVGVDVFFVISGFVITESLFGYSGTLPGMLAQFYERRVRRLFPAAVPVVLFTMAMAWVHLPPEELAEFARSLVAFLTFWSNWFFLSIAGYFDAPSELKPLLHTWSLSIEEQFYLLFPVPILLLLRRGRGVLACFFAAVFVMSLTYSVWLVETGQAENAFFNSLARFWEIALGGVLACGVVPAPRSEAVKTGMSVLGFTAILTAIFGFSATTPFPGLATLLPTIGAALIILANGGIVGRLLATRPIVWTGLISYAIYLWHWPIFVGIAFALNDPQPWHYAAGFGVTFFMATVSYHLIEKPIRLRRSLPRRWHAPVLFFGVAPFIIVSGVAGAMTEGFPGRFSRGWFEYQAKRIEMSRELQAIAGRGKCWMDHRADFDSFAPSCLTGARVLLTGDSHAAHLLPGLKAAFPNTSIDLLAVDSCALVQKSAENRPACLSLVRWIERLPKNYDTVLISSHGLSATNLPEFVERVSRLAQSRRVYVFGPIQFYKPNMPTLYASLIDSAKAKIAAAFDRALQDDRASLDLLLAEQLVGIGGVTYIPLLPAACPDGRCRHFDKNGWPVLIDNSHLSPQASRELMAHVAHRLKLDQRESLAGLEKAAP